MNRDWFTREAKNCLLLQNSEIPKFENDLGLIVESGGGILWQTKLACLMNKLSFDFARPLIDFVQYLPGTNFVGGTFQDLSATCILLVMTENLAKYTTFLLLRKGPKMSSGNTRAAILNSCLPIIPSDHIAKGLFAE